MKKPTPLTDLVSSVVESCVLVKGCNDAVQKVERDLKEAEADYFARHKALGRAAVRDGIVDDKKNLVRVMDIGGGKCVLFQWVYADPTCASVRVLPLEQIQDFNA